MSSKLCRLLSEDDKEEISDMAGRMFSVHVFSRDNPGNCSSVMSRILTECQWI